MDGGGGADGGEVAEVKATPTTAPALTSRMSVEVFNEELVHEKGRVAELDSVAACIAKINLLKAYEEEQDSRRVSLEHLKKIYDDLTTMTCPVLGKCEERYNLLGQGID